MPGNAIGTGNGAERAGADEPRRRARRAARLSSELRVEAQDARERGLETLPEACVGLLVVGFPTSAPRQLATLEDHSPRVFVAVALALHAGLRAVLRLELARGRDAAQEQ